MSTLNPYVFPLVPYPGPAPEEAPRSGMGGWEPYTLDSPNDALLPFVLARAASAANFPWVSCAWVQHADTGQRVYTFDGPTLGSILTKLLSSNGTTEYFTYAGDFLPTTLPCGLPLRLILDNAYQSPRFYALAPASQLRRSHLPLEWYDERPTAGVPYGAGFAHRFYLDNGSLQFLDPRADEHIGKHPDTGAEHTLALSLFAQKAFAIAPVPDYLAQALAAARGPEVFLADGERWKLLTVKAAPQGNGGRWSVAGTLESREPFLSRGCRAPLLVSEAYDPTHVPRGWRCGDTSDRASDWGPTGTYTCEVVNGDQTGYALVVSQDHNPYSTTFGQQTTTRELDAAHCPLPVRYQSQAYTSYAYRNDCPPGASGGRGPDVSLGVGAYTSRVSQADADRQAHVAADAQAQQLANSQGTCTMAATGYYYPTYAPNGCFSGLMVSNTNPGDVRDATADECATYRLQAYGSDGYECPSCRLF